MEQEVTEEVEAPMPEVVGTKGARAVTTQVPEAPVQAAAATMEASGAATQGKAGATLETAGQKKGVEVLLEGQEVPQQGQEAQMAKEGQQERIVVRYASSATAKMTWIGSKLT